MVNKCPSLAVYTPRTRRDITLWTRVSFWSLFRGRWIQSMHRTLIIGLHLFSHLRLGHPVFFFLQYDYNCTDFVICIIRSTYLVHFILLDTHSGNICRGLKITEVVIMSSWRVQPTVTSPLTFKQLFGVCFRNTWSMFFPWCTREILTLLITCTLS